jgi:hypothetical protein
MVAAVLLYSGIFAVAFADPEPAADVPPADLVLYQEVSRGVAARDTDAQVGLALWCEAHGLEAERLKHLALAVLGDPKNPLARGLLGFVEYGGKWKRPEAVADEVKADEALAARLAEYDARRGRLRPTADANWELGLWCEQNGLEPEARAQFTVVTRLDPAREAAWKRLGCKKVGGRWLSEAQIAADKDEAEAQARADKHWKPVLMKWRGWLAEKERDRAHRVAAEQALADVTDPRAVGAVWSVFVAGGEAHHDRAVRILGQIDAPASTRALAFLAVYDPSAEVRRTATETLRLRDPREFAGLLVKLLRKPIKYEVRPVGGPGSPGALFVEGKQFNVQRMYAPPGMPYVPVSPNDRIDLDGNGLPVITRQTQFTTSRPNGATSQFLTFSQFAQLNPTDPALAVAVADFRAHASSEWVPFLQHLGPHNRGLMRVNPAAEMTHLGVSISQNATQVQTQTQQTQIPVGQMMVEYQRAAVSAQMQLAQDIASVDRHNDEVKQLNGRVAQVLKDVSGQDRPEDPDAWRAWWVDLQGYAYIPSQEQQGPRPTLVQNVPLNDAPQPVPVISTHQTVTQNGPSGPAHVGFASNMPSCFGAGTLVRTLDGTRPIEAIQVGDRVLAQDIHSGALGYPPVTIVHHNPPSPTFLVKLAGDTIVSSPFHRFWVVGKGWIMARELRGGEVLRLLDGPARVESVEEGPVQLVYNLDVAEAHDFFAGAAAALVHDNTLPETRLRPFDASPDLAAATAAR